MFIKNRMLRASVFAPLIGALLASLITIIPMAMSDEGAPAGIASWFIMIVLTCYYTAFWMGIPTYFILKHYKYMQLYSFIVAGAIIGPLALMLMGSSSGNILLTKSDLGIGETLIIAFQYLLIAGVPGSVAAASFWYFAFGTPPPSDSK